MAATENLYEPGSLSHLLSFGSGSDNFNLTNYDTSGMHLDGLNKSFGNWASPQSLGIENAGIPGIGDKAPGAWDFGSPQMGQAIGLGMGALQGLQGIGNFYLGMKNYGVAKDTLKFNKQQYWNNFTSQARLTNAELRDRQASRYRTADRYGISGVDTSDSYMAKNGINEKGYN